MPNSGPSRMQMQRAERSQSVDGVVVMKVDDNLARTLSDSKRVIPFTEVFAGARRQNYHIGPGDTLVVSVWETPPAILFGGVALTARAETLATQAETLPPQMVMEDGRITIPFAGQIVVAGRTVREIEKDIVSRLQDKANNPQVVVRVVSNPTSQISVIGDVAKSTNISLTPKGERLLDALATAGGVTQPLTQVSLQLSREGTTATMPLDSIIRDPKQNILLRSGDVMAALFQPWTFSVLGAASKNAEIPFEAQGISLAQALARSGGLNDNRADPGGVFVFRFEDAGVVAKARPASAPPAINGKVPVVYQVDFNDPGAFFVTQNFPVQNKDVLYVANMPSAELEKFLRMIGLVVSPALNVGRYQYTVTQ